MMGLVILLRRSGRRVHNRFAGPRTVGRIKANSRNSALTTKAQGRAGLARSKGKQATSEKTTAKTKPKDRSDEPRAESARLKSSCIPVCKSLSQYKGGAGAFACPGPFMRQHRSPTLYTEASV